MMLSSSVRKLVTLVGLSVLSFILLQGHTSVIGESSSLAASVDAYLAELDSAEFDALTREIYVQAELVDELDPVTMMMEMQARAQIEGTHQAEVETEADAEGETEGEVATEGEGEAEAAAEGEAQAETATEGEAAAEGEAPAEGEAAAEGEATAEGEVAAEGEAAAEGGAEGEAAAEGEGEADNRKNGWEAPKLPPLAVGLTNETRPEIHPASGVPAGGVPPTQEELDGILAPQQPPEGCSHLIEAWKNYVWKFRTTSATGVVGKDQYTQAEVEVRFKNFCTNLKNHQLSLSSGRERMTIKLADLTFKNVSDEKLSWNKYFDYATLKPLRGFRYSLPFSHAMTHQQYLEREFIRNGGTDASPEARQQQLAQKLGELPNKINIAADGAQTPPAATAEAAEEPAAEAPAAAEGESETPAAEGEAPAAAEGEAEAPSGEGEAAASEEAAEGAATAVDVAVAFIEMADTLTDEPPVISTPTGALKPIARDPLVPDFDFSLNSNIVGPVMDQNNCGADWAIATSVLLEQTYAVQCQDAPYTQSLEQLHFGSVSAQQLISCATPTGRNGCQSGDVIDALKYAMRWPMRTIESYPLAPQTFLTGASETPSAPTCHVDPAVEASAAQPLISAFGHPIHSCRERNQHDAGNLCLEQDEEELARFVAKQPVTAVIDANDAVFGPTYSGYVITSKDCSSVVGAGDHVVIIVGLLTDADSGKKVWKIQNSYGQEWGEKGFAYLEYGYNTCGIANYNHYVQMTCQRPAGPNPLPRPPAPKIAPLSETASKPIEILPPKAKIQPTVPVVPVNPIIAPTSVPANPASGTHAGADSIPWWVRESATPNVVSPKLAQVGPKAPEPVRTTVPPLQTQPFVPIVPTVPVRPLPPAPVTATVPVPAPAQATPAIAPIAAGHVVNLATPIPAPAAAAAPVAAPPQPLAAAPQQAAPIQAQPVAAAVNVEPVQQQQPQAAPVAAPAVQVPVAIF